MFSGAEGGAESEIRRRIIENDLLGSIVALPDQSFYKTRISTYFWIPGVVPQDAQKPGRQT